MNYLNVQNMSKKSYNYCALSNSPFVRETEPLMADLVNQYVKVC